MALSIRLVSTSRIFPCRISAQQCLVIGSRQFNSNKFSNDIFEAKKRLNSNPESEKRTRFFRRYHYYAISVATGALIGTIYALKQVKKHEGALPEHIANFEMFEQKAIENRPVPTPVTKTIKFDRPPRGYFPFKLTLYQYASCPFCCKVRAYLNYNRIPYDIVEVNTLTNAESSWSLYNKLPMMVVEDEKIQLNDSSMIISVIESYLRQPTKTFRNTFKLFKTIVEKDSKGNFEFNHFDRYLIAEPFVEDRFEQNQVETETKKTEKKSFFSKLFFWRKFPVEEKSSPIDEKQNVKRDDQLDRQWREWVDDKLIHVISPNIYRSVSESIDTMRWFSQVGDWEKVFPWYQRYVFVYFGALGMRVLGVYLKKKYKLADDVRLDLYQCGNEWAEAISGKDFLGGSEPNIADLNVYGILSTMEGCRAFDDLMKNCQIQDWFGRMKNLIEPHRIDSSLRSVNS